MSCHGCTGQEDWGQVESPHSRFTWRKLDPLIEQRIDTTIQRWIGTPYAPGQRAKGAGVDCRQFVVAIIDELFRAKTPTVLNLASMDSGIHNPKIGFRVAHTVKRRYPLEVVRDNVVEPGDCLAVPSELSKQAANRIGHVMIAGGQPYTAYHASVMGGVSMTSITAYRVARIYRLLNKDQWI